MSHQLQTIESGNSVIINWKPEYEIGIQLIDMQHMRLLALLSNLAEAYFIHCKKETIEKIFSGFADYCHYHFRMEEVSLSAGKYSDYEKHKLEHAVFFNRVHHIKKNYSDDIAVNLEDSLIYMRDWLIEHFTMEDRKYVKSFK